MAVLDDLLQLLGGGDPEAEGAAKASTAMQPAVLSYLQDVLSGRMAASGLPENTYDPGRSFAANALDPRGIEQATNVAMGIGPGAISRDIRSGLPIITKDTDRLASPNISMGSEAPLFDYARLGEYPDVPQFNLERAPAPAKGIPERVQEIADPANLRRVNERVAEGLKNIGGEPSWYNIEQLRQGYQGELGAQRGQDAFDQYRKLMGPTSENTPVVSNARNASYIQNRLAQGEPFPTVGNIPSPWGMMGSTLKHAQEVLESGYSLDRPKTGSYSENFGGNYNPYTWDRHISTGFNLLDAKGKPLRLQPEWWNYAEPVAQEAAASMGLSPAAHQQGLWLSVEGVKSPREPFLKTFENRVRITAKALGEDPRQTLQRVYRMGLPGGLLAGAGIVGTDTEPSNP